MRRVILFLVLMLWAVTLTAHAQTIPAPVGQDILSTSPDKAVILAKDAAGQVFLYHVGSQTRVDFSGEVVNYLESIGRVPKLEGRTFSYEVGNADWRGNDVWFLVEGVGHGVTRFNRDTGQQISFYPSGIAGITARFHVSENGNRVSVYDAISKQGILYHLVSGQTYPYQSIGQGLPNPFSLPVFSPDDRFFALHTDNFLEVWDTQVLSPDGLPTYTMDIQGVRLWRVVFTSPVEFYGDNADTVVNLETRTLSRPNVALPSVAVGVTGESGYTIYSPECDRRYALRASPNRLEIFDNTSQTNVRLADETSELHYAAFSPNCRFIAVSTLELSPSAETGYHKYRMVIYNVETGQAIAQFHHDFGDFQLEWSPDSRYLWSSNRWENTYLLDTQTNRWSAMTFRTGRNQYTPYWDLERGQLLVMIDWTVHSIDLQTATLHYRYLPPLQSDDCSRSSTEAYCQWYVSNGILYFLGDEAVTAWDLNSSELIASARVGAPKSAVFGCGRLVQTGVTWSRRMMSCACGIYRRLTSATRYTSGILKAH